MICAVIGSWQNEHFSFFLFQQPEYEKDLNRKEQEKLHSKVNILSEEDKAMIYNKGTRACSGDCLACSISSSINLILV